MSKASKIERAKEIIYKYIYEGKSTIKLAAEYNIGDSCVGRIINGKAYPELDDLRDVSSLGFASIQELTKHRCATWYGDKYKDFEPITEYQESIIKGSVLGDAYISPGRPNSAFRKFQCVRKYEHVEWMGEKLQPYTSCIGKVHSTKKIVHGENGELSSIAVPKYHKGWRVDTLNHPYFAKMRDEVYPLGIKIVPRTWVLNEDMVTLWFVDDGVNSWRKREAMLCTQGFTPEDVEFLIFRLKIDLEINAHLRMLTNACGVQQPAIAFTGSGYTELMQVISPKIEWECFAYKGQWREAGNLRNTRLADDEVLQIMDMYRNNIGTNVISEYFNCSVNTIWSIVSGGTHTDVTNISTDAAELAGNTNKIAPIVKKRSRNSVIELPVDIMEDELDD